MLKKRLVGLVTVKGDNAVQSFGYKEYLPLGKIQYVVENLDRWGADEIVIQSIDRSILGLGPDFRLIEKIAAIGLSTPIVYGGGIKSSLDALNVIQLGAERVCIDSILHTGGIQAIKEISQKIGSQALILSCPVTVHNSNLLWLNYKTGQYKMIEELKLNDCKEDFSEVLLIDHINEGSLNSFQAEILNLFPWKAVPVLAFGGVSEPNQIIKFCKFNNFSAACIGNSLNYKELGLEHIRKTLKGFGFRQPLY
jgi:cyclase